MCLIENGFGLDILFESIILCRHLVALIKENVLALEPIYLILN